MADYSTARDAIAAAIAAVTITSPVSTGIARVYKFLPDSGSLDKFPCLMITGYQMRYLRGASGKRERMYVMGIRLATKPLAGSTADMQDIMDALKEAISQAFDSSIMLDLGGAYHLMEGPNWVNKEPQFDGGFAWDDGEILFSIKDSATFAP